MLLLSSNRMTHYFKQYVTPSGVSKNIYYLYKNLKVAVSIATIASANVYNNSSKKFAIFNK